MSALNNLKSVRYAKRLIKFNSVSRQTNRVISKFMEVKLAKYGFVIEKLEYRDQNNVRKVCLVGKKGGGSGGLAYFCHTDVVPADRWFSKTQSPFEPVIARERLYGRGSCDMKGSIACMLVAVQRYHWDELRSPIYFICTADEEVGFHGAKRIAAESRFYKEMVASGTKGVIGEPTSLDVVYAHKGSISIRAVSHGKSAHSATSFGKNANLNMIPFLSEMKAIHDETEQDGRWHNHLFSPPTVSWNIGINDNTRAINIKAAQSVCTVYARTMPEIDIHPLLDRVKQVADANQLELEIVINPAFYQDPQSPFVKEAMRLANCKSPRTVCYATDACYFSDLKELIVIGPGSIDQAHTSKEWISLEQLALGTELYDKMIRAFCVNTN
ncbi:MAG TPA: M20/M25/M40 family metallo-hydrolase [Pirellulaceae bacterium]|nr:M20/M25/M40 family metallo-hydrolase [Pirellulaceae bacterium]HMO93334.1 M20/M25/M40 family metallo-hydrolase [Pirellulaceae bacterium]HMP70105.1 M20/M25/M40 family metallo-hydrolase [Pirellulaceae bacterium]